MNACVTFSVMLSLLVVLPSVSACDVPYGPNSPHLSRVLSTLYPNGSLVQEKNSHYIFCYVESLNSTHYIISVEIDENGILTNRTNIHRYKSTVDTTDKNRPFTINSVNIIQHGSKNRTQDWSNDYYSASQETSSSSNRNNEYYNVQDASQNSFEIANHSNSYYSIRQKRVAAPHGSLSPNWTPDIAACNLPYRKSSPHLSSRMRASSQLFHFNHSSVQSNYYIICHVERLNTTHYIIRIETDNNGTPTNLTSIYRYKNVVNWIDENEPSTTNPVQPNVFNTDSLNWNNNQLNISRIPPNSSPNPIVGTTANPEEKRPISSDCLLPEQPEGGYFELSGCAKPCSKRAYNLVPEFSILTYTCKDNYVMKGNAMSICINQSWTGLPLCLKTCSPLKSTSVDISCSYQGKMVSCIKDVLPGTRAMLTCKPSYTLPSTDPVYREITCLNDGLWNNYVFRCLECGTSAVHGHTLIIGGRDARIGIFPWHVGIYQRSEPNTSEYEQICGGALISSNFVISAAHCFYDEIINKVSEASEYAVGAGKHYRDWNTAEVYAQKSSVESIRVRNRYSGYGNHYAEDIAMLKLKRPFELTALVRLVCIDWSNQYEREQLQERQVGKSVGWGKDITDKSTKKLQEINMPYIPYRQCWSEVPVNFRGYITSDKFCAGNLDDSSVCDGDSGGGLCFEKNNTWYLRGIVSVSPVKPDNTCDYTSYAAFTRISDFLEWIRQAYLNVI